MWKASRGANGNGMGTKMELLSKTSLLKILQPSWVKTLNARVNARNKVEFDAHGQLSLLGNGQ